jgi:hypothetical protein
MKKIVIFLIAGLLLASVVIFQGCSFSTANLSSLRTSKDKEGKSESTKFEAGDTLYGSAAVSNNPGKVKVKLYLTVDDVHGLTKGDTLKGSDVSVDVDGDGAAAYSVPVSAGFPAGTYKLNADMLNDSGEKKDSKSVNVTIAAPSE